MHDVFETRIQEYFRGSLYNMWLRDVDREENLCCSNVLGASKIASLLYIRLLLTHGYLYELIVQEIIFQASP